VADFVEKLSAKRFEVHRATRCRGYGRDQLPIIVAPTMDSEFFNKIGTFRNWADDLHLPGEQTFMRPSLRATFDLEPTLG
jgi:hypothetical protein